MLRHLLAAEYLDERDEDEAILEVRLQGVDVFAGVLQVLIGPACEGVLLDALPLGVLGKVSLLGQHFLLLGRIAARTDRVRRLEPIGGHGVRRWRRLSVRGGTMSGGGASGGHWPAGRGGGAHSHAPDRRARGA